MPTAHAGVCPETAAFRFQLAKEVRCVTVKRLIVWMTHAAVQAASHNESHILFQNAVSFMIILFRKSPLPPHKQSFFFNFTNPKQKYFLVSRTEVINNPLTPEKDFFCFLFYVDLIEEKLFPPIMSPQYNSFNTIKIYCSNVHIVYSIKIAS